MWEETDGGAATWVEPSSSGWGQVGTSLLDLLTHAGKAAVDAKYEQPYELQKMRMQALGQLGYYDEGQAGLRDLRRQPGGTIPPMWLLIGGAVLLVVALKD